MLQKGNIFLEKMMTARDKIATKGAERLPDNSVINTYTKYYFCLKKDWTDFFFTENFGAFKISNCVSHFKRSPQHA